jgi:raffinose/stachyose/melibiose transport system substrate-binding protein
MRNDASWSRRALLGSAAFSALGASLSACGVPSSSGSGAGTAPSAVSTAIPAGKVTLNLATSENAGLTKGLISAFEKQHPNITINFKYTDYNDYDDGLGLQLASDSSPDIVLLNMVGTTVKDNLLLNLDPYVQAYGWDKIYPSGQLEQWRVAADGSTLGSGHLWAAPAGFSMVGVFYNKTLAARLGIAGPPATIDEFQAALDKAKAAGEVGLQLANLDGHSAFVVQSFADSVDGAAAVTTWFNGEPGASFDTPGNLQGAQALADWAKNGEIASGANGTDLTTAVADFIKGQGLFLVDGNWDAAQIDKAMPGTVGFFPFPKASASGKYAAVGGCIAYGISARSKNANAAAAFLNFWSSAQAAQVQFQYGFMPTNSSSLTPSSASVMSDMVKAWTAVNQDNGLVGFYANVTSSMNGTLTSASQSLIAGKTTAQQYLQTVQADWTKTHG